MDEENSNDNSSFYINYVYNVNIQLPEDIYYFDYEIFQGENKIREETFKITTRVLDKNINDLKFIVFGDHVYEKNDKIIQVLEQQLKNDTIDIIFILGDISYELFFNFGKNGDEYFKEFEKLTSQIPIIFIAGNHDFADDFELLYHRFNYPGQFRQNNNNLFHFEIKGNLFIFINPDYYITRDINDRIKYENKLKNYLENFNKKQDQQKMKFIFSHRQYYCLNAFEKESCVRFNKSFFKKLYNVMASESLDVFFTGHLHLYQRFDTHIFHTQRHLVDSELDQPEADFITYIIGTGGKHEDVNVYQKQELMKDDEIYYKWKMQGYVVVNLTEQDNEQIFTSYFLNSEMVNKDLKNFSKFEYKNTFFKNLNKKLKNYFSILKSKNEVIWDEFQMKKFSNGKVEKILNQKMIDDSLNKKLI